jgi:hypothetical protein
VVSQAREFVWGLDVAEINFVRTCIGSVPDRIILSEEQREEVPCGRAAGTDVRAERGAGLSSGARQVSPGDVVRRFSIFETRAEERRCWRGSILPDGGA